MEARGFVRGSVAVRRLGGAWTVVCKGSRCGRPIFVNKDVLALDTIKGLRFIRADGQPLSPEFRIREFESGPEAALMAGYYCTCARGNRFAVPVFSDSEEVRYGGGLGLFNLFRILVFDLPSGQWIASLEASQHKIKRICDVALSPDGTLLALFRQEGIVEVYPLPAATPTAPPAPQAK